MTRERMARLLVLSLALGPPVAVLAGAWVKNGTVADTLIIRGRMARDGGWLPANLVLDAGTTVRLRLTSDDVMHGFAVGRVPLPGVDVPPGRVVETTLTLSEPGTYAFYCTRWCGPDHWRMRGTIEVRGGGGDPPATPTEPPTPLYVALGLDLDALRVAPSVPGRVLSAERGASSLGTLGAGSLRSEDYGAQSPADAWQVLREDRRLRALSDDDVWDIVAAMWRSQASAATLAQGAELYSSNCAACHGVQGRGDGVMARALVPDTGLAFGHGPRRPADFTDARRMLAASPALLYGKVQRGGMGTGMPNWGPILTDEQTWAVVAYLWTFQLGADSGASR